MLDVGPYGARRDVQPPGDLPVGAAGGQFGQHLELPRRESAGSPPVRGAVTRGAGLGRGARVGIDGRGEGLGEQDDHCARRIGRAPRPTGADVQHADVPAVSGEQALGHAVLDAEGTQHLLETRGRRQELPETSMSQRPPRAGLRSTGKTGSW
ncbi:hypothetical protein FM21_15600 [Streptomyces mutabilis]|uniref:Uncharacterized protein n=1 Tax=Streptomyces mutabilis TaxID=67332 RepID=A0A086N8C9_9ACTN|nr:hypothetical protein FM21_15600 [Streptomyces mutabilis]